MEKLITKMQIFVRDILILSLLIILLAFYYVNKYDENMDNVDLDNNINNNVIETGGEIYKEDSLNSSHNNEIGSIPLSYLFIPSIISWFKGENSDGSSTSSEKTVMPQDSDDLLNDNKAEEYKMLAEKYLELTQELQVTIQHLIEDKKRLTAQYEESTRQIQRVVKLCEDYSILLQDSINEKRKILDSISSGFNRDTHASNIGKKD